MTPITDEPEPAAGERYRESAVLGVGGMAKVVLARDARIGRDVAVKQLHADRELTTERRDRFLREARVQARLEHPSIVPVYDIDTGSDGSAFFTMRRVVGRTLEAILDELRAGNSHHTQRELLAAFTTVCLTLDYAHARGVIHRDVKPANIMLGDFGEVYVLDWGLARLASEPDERIAPGTFLGTPLYMAPEQRTTHAVDPTADVFALGAILFELLALQPLRDPDKLHVPPDARLSRRTPDRRIAPELEAICVRATQLVPADRYPSARALHDALARYLEGDRDLERRRQLAADHGHAARDALARADTAADHEHERGIAMRELVRALALDPTDDDHVATLAQILETPPRTLPAAVTDQMAASEQQIVRSGARHVVVASCMWFGFLPLVLAMGLRDSTQLVLILAPITISGALALLAARMPRISPSIMYAIVATTLLAVAGVSRLYGPLVLVPTLVAAMSIVIQAHPSPTFSRVSWAMCALVLVGATLGELAGVVPASYTFEHGTMTIVPQLVELPAVGSIALLAGASLALMIVPAVFIGRLRTALTAAQQQLLVQAWHFRRLGDQLVEAGRSQRALLGDTATR